MLLFNFLVIYDLLLNQLKGELSVINLSKAALESNNIKYFVTRSYLNYNDLNYDLNYNDFKNFFSF